MQIFRDANFNFIRWRWHAIVLSAIAILVGVVSVVTRDELPLGVDFSGGTIVVVRFDAPVATEAVRDAVAGIEGDEVVQRYGDADANEWLVRLPQLEGDEEGGLLGQGSQQIVESLTAAGLPAFEVISTEIVGPVIGEDLQRRGIYATVLAMLGILLYITFRFRFSFAVGAMAASLHDVFITLSLLIIVGYELSLNVVAAILTLVGYGVNDQIVIFDRVRENLRKMRREPMDAVINRSVNQTLPRTVVTAGTTALALLALYLFGGEVIEPFAFTMLVGVISSTYSTVYIASAIAAFLSERGQRASAAGGAVDAGAEADARPGRKARRARAS